VLQHFDSREYIPSEEDSVPFDESAVGVPHAITGARLFASRVA